MDSSEMMVALVWGLLILTNSAAFLILLWDKTRSRMSGAERVPEGMVFFLAACFGSAGVLLGMFLFRHKTRKWYFLIGIPLLLAQNVVFLFFLLEKME